MAQGNVIIRFDEVTFEYGSSRRTLDEASFSVREGSKITLMGQNGAGKSTLFKLITGELKPKEGSVFTTPKDASIGVSLQVMPKQYLDLTIREFFMTNFQKEDYHLDRRVKEVFEPLNISLPLDRKVGDCSGGQQARLLLAYALIPDPDILLLDEPTNNLDQSGIDYLTGFLMVYPKTCIVISHDADFLNAFTDGVLYLDVHTNKIEQYVGNYFDVVDEIGKRIERERLQNARMDAEIQRMKDQANVFAHKGGKLRSVAKRLRDTADEKEEQKVDVRREDKPIREFSIPVQSFDQYFDGKIVSFNAIDGLVAGEVVARPFDMILRKKSHVTLKGPNGIGKSTLLERIVNRDPSIVTIPTDMVIGYYRQDFSNLDYSKTGYEVLREAVGAPDEQLIRGTASVFLLNSKALDTVVALLSEGQKGLLSLARIVLLKPALIVLDEPTNHMNFRHIPVMARALDSFEGALILVSHVPDFVAQIRIDEEIDLPKLLA